MAPIFCADSCPVLPTNPVTTTDGLMQNACAINQRHRDAVDFGLYPDILAVAQPCFHGLGFMQFIQAGMGDGVRD